MMNKLLKDPLKLAAIQFYTSIEKMKEILSQPIDCIYICNHVVANINVL